MSWNQVLRENVTKAEQLREYLHLSHDEEKMMTDILERYPMSITPYYLSLIDFNDPDDPIRKMCIPSIQETDMSGSFDTSGEKENTVIDGMQHKYEQTVMILSTNQCAMYCRHCFRKRLVGMSQEEIARNFDKIVEYIKDHKKIKNTLISGGDSFLNKNEVIEKYLKEFTAIEHLDFIRFGTRVPVVFPQRIYEDSELLETLKQYGKKKQIYVVTQFNHPKELTNEAVMAIRSLQDVGVVIKNQTVLLKGVNDDPDVLTELLKKLTQCGVNPYYVFQCRPVTGVKNQFQRSLEDAYDIVQEAKNRQSGIGKCFKFAFSHKTGKIEVIGKLESGELVFQYHEAKDPENMGKIFVKKMEPGQAWL